MTKDQNKIRFAQQDPGPVSSISVVKIKEDPIDGILKDFSGWIDRVIDEMVLRKVDSNGYRNNLKGNLRIWPAIVISFYWFAPLVFSTLYFFFDSPEAIESIGLGPLLTFYVSVTSAFIASVSGIFWKEKSSLYNKWEYLAALYNDMNQADPARTLNEYPKREFLRVSLAFDILVMDMWAHRSFADVFHDCLSDAIMSYEQSESTGKEIVGQLVSIGLSRKRANGYLEAYQERLLKRVRANYVA